MNKTERLFALAEHLRARRTGVTAEQLAERFGVTVRTIYRDLDALRAAHLPLGAERGRGGGYALDKSYSLPPVNFTAREAALFVSSSKNDCRSWSKSGRAFESSLAIARMSPLIRKACSWT